LCALLPYVLVERLAAEAVLLSVLRSALPGGGPLAQLLGPVSTELGLAPFVLACRLGNRNALTLSFQDQGVFELGKGPIIESSSLGSQLSLAGACIPKAPMIT
jgi:hypothetical protein